LQTPQCELLYRMLFQYGIRKDDILTIQECE
jgi:hypothetical protein